MEKNQFSIMIKEVFELLQLKKVPGKTPIEEYLKYKDAEKLYQQIRENINLYRLRDTNIEKIQEILGDFETIYNCLSNEESKEIFKKMFKFRLAWIVSSDITYSNTIAECSNKTRFRYAKEGISCFYNKSKRKYEIGNYLIDTTPYEFSETWIYKNYFYFACCPKEGQTVIDIGGYYGESAIWFADLVGEKGHVFTFEMNSNNIKKLNNNLAINHMQKYIDICEYALWDKKEIIYFFDEGPETGIDITQGDNSMQAIQLDDWNEQKKLDEIDYIKIDVEGSEMNVLKGARKVIERYKPDFAICVYHNFWDIYNIIKYLKEIVPEYKIYLNQKVPFPMDTVLFATIC